MRSLFIFLGLLFFQLNALGQFVNVELVLKFKENYCGGARPSEAMEEEFNKTKAFAFQKMILLKGKKADTLITDKDGVLKVRLRKGNYTLMEPWRYYKRGANGLELSIFDLRCLEQEWSKACIRISIKKRKAKVEHLNEIIHVCDWQSPCVLEGKQPPVPE